MADMSCCVGVGWWWCGWRASAGNGAARLGLVAAPERMGMLREEKLAGMVPVPVAARMAGSACCSSHSMVSPSDLCPSSRVSWNTRAAHIAGIRIRRPRPSTLVCRSLDGRFATVPAAGAAGTSAFLSPAADDGCAWSAATGVMASAPANGDGCCCCCCGTPELDAAGPA
uniref:Uncharacterized protein n=1 Tax=Arundo donax TaxID=35708 RepID=A0A0A9EVN3_ARUDO